jgi:hypothetical protein
MSVKRFGALRVIAGVIVGLLVVAYVGACAWLYVNQKKLTYYPNTETTPAATVGLADFQQVAIRTPDGETLVGFWKAPAPGRGVVIYLHGNGGNILRSPRAERMRALADDGFGVLGIDYRGYGGSTGSPSEKGLLTDANAAFDWAHASAPASKIAVFGESLGTGVSVHLASVRPVAGVALDSPYAAIVRVGEIYYPGFPHRLLLKDQFWSERWIRDVHAPVFIAHCTADEQIPLKEAQRLFAAANQPKEMMVIKGCAHIQTWEKGAKAKMLADFHLWTDPK